MATRPTQLRSYPALATSSTLEWPRHADSEQQYATLSTYCQVPHEGVVSRFTSSSADTDCHSRLCCGVCREAPVHNTFQVRTTLARLVSCRGSQLRYRYRAFISACGLASSVTQGEAPNHSLQLTGPSVPTCVRPFFRQRNMDMPIVFGADRTAVSRVLELPDAQTGWPQLDRPTCSLSDPPVP